MMAAVKSGFRRLLALVGYGAAVVCLAGIGAAALADLYDRAQAVSAAEETLARMDGHRKTPAGASSTPWSAVRPFWRGRR